MNVTAMMTAQQCFLVAVAGATWVSIFGGRVFLRDLLDQFFLPAQIIVGSTEVFNIAQWLDAGEHIMAAIPALVEDITAHPYSKETIQVFLEDAKRLRGTGG